MEDPSDDDEDEHSEWNPDSPSPNKAPQRANKPSPDKLWLEDSPSPDRAPQRVNKPPPDKLWLKTLPKRSLEPTVVQRPDLTILRRSFDALSPFRQTDDQLLTWLRSCDVLPLLKRWKEACIDINKNYLQIQHDLPKRDMPWDSQADQIAEWMKLFDDTQASVAEDKNGTTLIFCARFARRMCNGQGDFFEQFKPYAVGQKDRFLICARVILTAYHDLRLGDHGFFGVLLRSEFAGLVSQGARKAWEKKYPFKDETP